MAKETRDLQCIDWYLQKFRHRNSRWVGVLRDDDM
jgi:hypothetical protein